MTSEQALTTQIMRIVNKLIFIDKKSIFEFQGVKLYPSEIHLMQVIYTDQELNSTEMAQRLSVTKGAVSQTLSRLEKKGILIKNKDPYLKNKLTVDFTELGQAAMRSHRLYAQALENEYQYYLSTLTEKDKNIIRSFLSKIETFVDRLG